MQHITEHYDRAEAVARSVTDRLADNLDAGGYTDEDAAAHLDIPTKQLQKYLRGEQAIPVEYLFQLTDLLGVKLSEFVRESEEATK